MKLEVSSDQSGSPTVRVSWCLSKGELKKIAEDKLQNLHVLLILVCNRTNFHRVLIPLAEMMTYVSFRSPGKNTIFAQLVYSDNERWLKHHYLEKNRRGGWEELCYDSSDDDLWEKRLKNYVISTRETVDVAKEFFAPEPSAWMAWWVSLWYETLPKDQCQFRRRQLFIAFPLQPLPVLLWVVFTGLVRFLSALYWFLVRGRLETNWKPIVHPFMMSGDDVSDKAEGSRNFWTHKKNGEERNGVAQVFLLPFHPISFAVGGVVLRLINPLHLDTIPISSMLKYLALGPIAVLSVFLIILAVVVIFFVLNEVSEKLTPVLMKKLGAIWIPKEMPKKRIPKKTGWVVEFFNSIKKELEKRELRISEERREIVYNEIALLSCENGPVKTLADLPEEKRTFKLRFLDLKAKVCRPFAS